VALTPAGRARILQIARDGVLKGLGAGSGAQFEAPADDPELTSPAGCFVSLHEHSTHRLRGCVGRLDPNLPLVDAVRETAADVLHDPRFVGHPVTRRDVDDLEIEVSVLSPPREAASMLDFDLLSDGIYVTFGNRAGFFLPQVARETGWTKEQLLDRLCLEKLGLPADAWREPGAKLFTFKVEVVGPEPV
jgi:AmmeMemoRadiSam system protein A